MRIVLLDPDAVLARLHRGRKLFERELWIYAEETELSETGDTR